MTIIVSLLIIVWASMLIQRKNSGAVLILLSFALLLVGGGFTPLPFGLLAGVSGIAMRSSPGWWQAHLSTSLRRTLAGSWRWFFLASGLWYLGIFQLGSFFKEYSTILGLLVLILCLLAAWTAFVHDIQRQTVLSHIHTVRG